MSKRFTIELSSNLNFERMVVYISCGDQELFLLNYDRGIDNIEVEVLPNTMNKNIYMFSLEDFLDVITKAKEILIKCAEEDKSRELY